MFEEEKNVADKAPVEESSVDISSLDENKKDTKLTKKFNYIIKIANFYYELGKTGKRRIMSETNIKKVNIVKTTVFRLSIELHINQLKILNLIFEKMEKLYFENLELIKQ